MRWEVNNSRHCDSSLRIGSEVIQEENPSSDFNLWDKIQRAHPEFKVRKCCAEEAVTSAKGKNRRRRRSFTSHKVQFIPYGSYDWNRASRESWLSSGYCKWTWIFTLLFITRYCSVKRLNYVQAKVIIIFCYSEKYCRKECSSKVGLERNCSSSHKVGCNLYINIANDIVSTS